MRINLHTHTYRCHHASDVSDRLYIENAISAGFETLGFSEHIPCPFPDGHESSYRLFKRDIDEYFNTLRQLKEEYKNDINILVGFEAEYYPKYFNDMVNFVAPYKPEYFILGQHFTYNEEDGQYCAIKTDSYNCLKNYVDNALAGIETGKFTYLCHPDLINFTGDKKLYVDEMTRLCVGAKQHNIPLEFNFHGWRLHRHYPCSEFFKIAAQVGNDVVLGCDAHSPEAIITDDTESDALKLLGELGIKPLEIFPVNYLCW